MTKLLTLLSFAWAILSSSPSCFAATYSLFIKVEQRNHILDTATYDFTFYLQELGSVSDLAITSPTGIVHQEPISGAPFLDVRQTGLSLEALNDNFLGDWIFEETLNGVTKSYSIALPEVQESLFDIPVPVITSPADGAILGKVFDLTWTNPEPSGATFTYSTQDMAPSLGQVMHLNGPGHFTLDFTVQDEFLPIIFTDFRIIKRLPELSIDVTRMSSNADATFLRSYTRLEVHSPSISFLVVPEPACMLLVPLAVVLATSGRGFVWKGRPLNRKRR